MRRPVRRQIVAMGSTVVTLLLVGSVGALGPGGARADSVTGSDRALIVPPTGAVITEYENFGYSLHFVEGGVEVLSDASPFRSATPFDRPGSPAEGEMVELALRLTAGSKSRQQAVTRILTWMSGHVRYEIDRSESQDAAAVLERRSGYCTGIARLTVELLRAVEIPAREVPGYVVADGDGGSGGTRGYHRWVEVHYDDLGWVFSDPLATHHWVPATYVRLGSEELIGDDIRPDAQLVSRSYEIRGASDVWGLPAGVLVRHVTGVSAAPETGETDDERPTGRRGDGRSEVDRGVSK